MVNINGVFPASVHAVMSDTAAAGVRHLIAVKRTLVTSNVDHLDHVRIRLISADRELHTFRKNRALFINTTAQRRRFPGHNDLRDLRDMLQKRTVPCHSRRFAQHLIFQVLNLSIKFSHLYDHSFPMEEVCACSLRRPAAIAEAQTTGLKNRRFFKLFSVLHESEITYLDSLSHFFQAVRKLADQLHFNIKIDRKIRILMCGINRPTDIKIDVGRFLK